MSTVRLLSAALLGALAAAGCVRQATAAASAAAGPAAPAVPEAPRSVILLIGDGMGPQQVGLLMDWAEAAERAPTAFERLAASGAMGLLRTGAEGTPLTDSAAGATALATGVEVPNGFIATDARGKAVRTCLEDAQVTGRMTGLVTTTRITHATPAAFAGHVTRRSMEKEIGRQFLESSGVDVLLGGGARFIDVAAAREGHRVVTSRDALLAAKKSGGRLLGLFADSHLPYAIDRDAAGEEQAPTLAEMTTKALEFLAADPDGFFLMVEGGRIDHGCHLNDVGAALGELREFDAAIAVAEAFRRAHPGTLVVVTADHETGGLALTSGRRPLLDRDLLAMARQERSIEAAAPPAGVRGRVDPNVFGVGRRNFYPEYSWWETSRALATSATYNVSYATQGHSATPVVVVAAGPGAQEFTGVHANEHVGRLLRRWMQIPAATGSEDAR